MAKSPNEGSRRAGRSEQIKLTPKARALLHQASLSLESAIAAIESDQNGALDDVLAAQLCIHTLLAASIDGEVDSDRPKPT